MSHYILASEIIFLAGAGLRILYSGWFAPKPNKFPAVENQTLCDLQSLYGYNEHSLVGISAIRNAWIDERTDSAVSYSERGKVWLAAGETLAADENLLSSTERFLEAARDRKKIVAFLPATEKFARLITASTQMRAVKIGASPCFDLQSWNPRGNKAKSLRAGLNRARRINLSFGEISDTGEDFRQEVSVLCGKWLKTRRSPLKFGWLFELAPFRNAEKKRFFTLRDESGKLVGLLTASPIPAREGWYLEDVLRLPDSPDGTAEMLVFETMKLLAAEGSKFATLGTAPLAEDGVDALLSEKNYLTKRIIKFSRNYLNGFYNFKGIRNFKAKFVPCRWESEYVLIPRGLHIPPLVLKAFLRTIFGEK